MRRWTLLGLVVAATLGASTPALAHGGPPVTSFTETFHGMTETFTAVPTVQRRRTGNDDLHV